MCQYCDCESLMFIYTSEFLIFMGGGGYCKDELPAQFDMLFEPKSFNDKLQDFVFYEVLPDEYIYIFTMKLLLYHYSIINYNFKFL